MASLQICNKICTDRQRQALCTALQNCNYSCNFTVQNSTQRRVGRGVHWATRGRCLQCLVAKILCVFNRLEPVRGAAVVVLLQNIELGTSAPAFCVFCLAPCRQSADRCTVSENTQFKPSALKPKLSWFKGTLKFMFSEKSNQI